MGIEQRLSRIEGQLSDELDPRTRWDFSGISTPELRELQDLSARIEVGAPLSADEQIRVGILSESEAAMTDSIEKRLDRIECAMSIGACAQCGGGDDGPLVIELMRIDYADQSIIDEPKAPLEHSPRCSTCGREIIILKPIKFDGDKLPITAGNPAKDRR